MLLDKTQEFRSVLYCSFWLLSAHQPTHHNQREKNKQRLRPAWFASGLETPLTWPMGSRVCWERTKMNGSRGSKTEIGKLDSPAQKVFQRSSISFHQRPFILLESPLHWCLAAGPSCRLRPARPRHGGTHLKGSLANRTIHEGQRGQAT